MQTFKNSDEYIQRVSGLLRENRGPLDIIREVETYELPENPNPLVELIYVTVKGILEEETEDVTWDLNEWERSGQGGPLNSQERQTTIDAHLVGKSKELISELEAVIREQHKIYVGPYELKAFYGGNVVATKLTTAKTLEEAKKELAAWAPYYLPRVMNGLTHLHGDSDLLRASVVRTRYHDARRGNPREYEVFSISREQINELYKKGQSQWFGMLNPRETKVIKIFFIPVLFRQVEDTLERLEFSKDNETSDWAVAGSVDIDQKIRTEVQKLLIADFNYHGTSAIFQIVPRDFEKDKKGNDIKRYSINIILQEPVELPNDVRGWKPVWKKQSVAALYSVF